VAVEPLECHRNDAPVRRTSPRGVEEGEGVTTSPFLEVVEHEEVGVELTMVGSRPQHSDVARDGQGEGEELR
jgi:hypothetical protein